MARYIATPEVPTGFANRCVYSTPGTYTFTVPSGVTSIKALAVGGGSAGSTGFIEGATVSTITHCNTCTFARGFVSGCCCYANCLSACICGYACTFHCLPKLKTCLYAYAGSGGGYAEKTISVSPGDTFSVVVGNDEESSSFGSEITATGAQAPCLCCCELFPGGIGCCGYDITSTSVSGSSGVCRFPTICCCCGTGYKCRLSCTRIPSGAICYETASGNNIFCIAQKPGCGIGGDKNYTGGAGQTTSIVSNEVDYISSTCSNGCACGDCCTSNTSCPVIDRYSNCSCLEATAYFMVSACAACCLPFQNSVLACLEGFCAWECFNTVRWCNLHTQGCTCLVKDTVACFMWCSRDSSVNTWYGHCKAAFEASCKTSNYHIPSKFNSSGDFRAEVELPYSGPSSGSPLGDGKPGACAEFVGTGPSTSTKPILHYCLAQNCYTAHFFYNCGNGRYCCDGATVCWGQHPWYAIPETSLSHWYEEGVTFETDPDDVSVGRRTGNFPGCVYYNSNLFNYVDFTPAPVNPAINLCCYPWNGFSKETYCSLNCRNRTPGCAGTCFWCQMCSNGSEGCDGWSRGHGMCLCYCGNLAATSNWRFHFPFHLNGHEVGCNACDLTSTSYNNCLKICCYQHCAVQCAEVCTGTPCSRPCSSWDSCDLAANMNCTCLIRPCMTIDDFVSYSTPNVWLRNAAVCVLDHVCGLRGIFQSTLTALTFLSGKCYQYYCNGSMYCTGCAPQFIMRSTCTDKSISVCHCCTSSGYDCGNWWCNATTYGVCSGNGLDLVLPGSAGGPNSCGNIPCQVTGSYLTTGPGADPSGVDIPKFISTGGGSSVMSQDTFNEILHEYKGNFAAWYLRKCWAVKCDIYVDGGTTCCCNCCILPLSYMDNCGDCCCNCVINTHFCFGCANMCWTPEKCAVLCYSFKLYACMMAELERKQGLTYECEYYRGADTGGDQPKLATTLNVGSAAGLYINSVSNNFVGQKTCLSGGSASTTQYYLNTCEAGKICACCTGNCAPYHAYEAFCYSPNAACRSYFTACLDDSTEPECKFFIIPNPNQDSQCYFKFVAPCIGGGGNGNIICGLSAGCQCQNYSYQNACCGNVARAIKKSVESGGGSGSSPYVPEIYNGPKIDDEYLFSSTECIIGASPQICIQGSSTTIAPGFSQGGGKSGCMGLLCDQQIVTNNAYNGGIFPRGTPGYGGGGTLCGAGGTGLVVVYWN